MLLSAAGSLALALPARKEVARLRHLTGPALPPEQRLESHRVERRLRLTPAVDAPALLDAGGAPGLVVPDVEGAVLRLVDAVDRAAEQDAAASAEDDLDRIGAAHAVGVHRVLPAESDFEPPRRHALAAELGLAPEKCPAGDEDRLPLRFERDHARGRYAVAPGLDALVRDCSSVNPAVTSFEASCFSGIYITGDITQEYLDGVEALRRGGESAEASAVTQLDLGLELAEQG